MMHEQRLIAVFGGTGFLGARVVSRLLRTGHRVRVAARHPERKPELLHSDQAEACRADLFDVGSLQSALKGVDGAVNATSLYMERGKLTYHAVHVEAAARLAMLARQAGVNGFVQLSGIGADQNASDKYVKARGQGEKAVRAAHDIATIVRPAAMFGQSDALLSAIHGILRRSPVFPLFGDGDTRLQPACVDDVACAIGRLVETDSVPMTYELGGNDTLTYRQLIDCVAQATGHSARKVPVPFALWRPLAGIAERLPGAPLTRAQVALMQMDNVASSALPGMASLDIAPRGVIAYVQKAFAQQSGD